LDFDNFQSEAQSNVPAILDAVPPSFRSIPSEVTDTDFKRTRLNVSNTFRLGANLTTDFGLAQLPQLKR